MALLWANAATSDWTARLFTARGSPREGIPVASPVRSIVDVADAGGAPEQVVNAVREALERGLVTRRHLVDAAAGRGGRVERLIRGAVNEAAT